MIERRSVNLPVQVERRRGPRCENCGVGTLNPVPAGHRNPGSLQCDHPGCGDIKARQTDAMECVIRSS